MFTVIYRTGGTLNFKWRKTVPVESYQAALKCCEEIERGGRPALVLGQLASTIYLMIVSAP